MNLTYKVRIWYSIEAGYCRRDRISHPEHYENVHATQGSLQFSTNAYQNFIFHKNNYFRKKIVTSEKIILFQEKINNHKIHI